MEHEKLYNSIHEMIHRIEKQLNDIKKANVLKENEQIKNIRAAVNPHFQFNILNSAIWMLEDNLTEEVIDVLTALGKHYRNALSIKNEYTTVGDEIETTYNYFKLYNMTVEKKK